MKDILRAKHDCTSSSKSYNSTLCESLKQKCPLFCKDKAEDENCSAELVKQGVSCDEKLLGQCVKLNGDGKQLQTLNNPGMSYKHK